jgi:hypothetical protein
MVEEQAKQETITKQAVCLAAEFRRKLLILKPVHIVFLLYNLFSV